MERKQSEIFKFISEKKNLCIKRLTGQGLPPEDDIQTIRYLQGKVNAYDSVEMFLEEILDD